MSAKRTDELKPGDLVEVGLVTATRIVKAVTHSSGHYMHVEFHDDIYVEDKPIHADSARSRLWILPANQPNLTRRSNTP